MQYVLSSKELTELAKEVAAAVASEKSWVPEHKCSDIVRAVFADNQIRWDDE